MNDNIYKYSKDNAIAFLLLVVISTVVIFTPAFTIQYIGLDLAFSFVFITEILMSTKGIFYPMLLHAGINGFVILLNIL
uniref:Conceptual translation n=1 Tax=Escherichia coli TaxID=562 RepID=A0A0F7Q221_ECOLX|nr:hypothetical protein [Escherichia coli]AKI06827.1 conceptual translation [Escherichia coli]